MNALALAAGFLAGGFARHLVNLSIGLPWSTVFVNLSGCLVIGAAEGYARSKGLSLPVRLAVMTGFCGAYTTFSTLILELQGMLAAGRYGAAALHYLGGGFAGLLLFRLGSLLAARL